MDIFRQSDSGSGAELIQNIYKERIIHSGFTLDNGIVMVQYQTGIF